MGTGKLVPRFETHGAWTRQTLHKDPQNFREFDVGGAGAYPSNRFTPGGRFVHAHVLPFEYGDP